MTSRHDDQAPPSNHGECDAIEVIVAVLRTKFGANAMAVAQRQSLNAYSESAPQWLAIVSRLST